MKINEGTLFLSLHDTSHVLHSYEMVCKTTIRVPADRLRSAIQHELDVAGIENKDYDRIVLEIASGERLEKPVLKAFSVGLDVSEDDGVYSCESCYVIAHNVFEVGAVLLKELPEQNEKYFEGVSKYGYQVDPLLEDELKGICIETAPETVISLKEYLDNCKEPQLLL